MKYDDDFAGLVERRINQGFSFREVARQLGISHNAIHGAVFRLRERGVFIPESRPQRHDKKGRFIG